MSFISNKKIFKQDESISKNSKTSLNKLLLTYSNFENGHTKQWGWVLSLEKQWIWKKESDLEMEINSTVNMCISKCWNDK